MNNGHTTLQNGIPAFKDVIQGFHPGDNCVWQSNDVRDYRPFAHALNRYAEQEGKEIAYFRFASHDPVLEQSPTVHVYEVDPNQGFELFTVTLRKIILERSPKAFFVFDCLSELQTSWFSDLMLGNFYVLICPYILGHGSLAFFNIIRNRHSHAVTRLIRNTTQLLIDTYSFDDTIHIHPIKVEDRYTPTMFLPHRWNGTAFDPITESSENARIVSAVKGSAIAPPTRVMDVWDRVFINAAESHATAVDHAPEKRETTDKRFELLARMMLTSHDRVMDLVKQYLTMDDIFSTKNRLIGSGMIGGKALGMLIARAVLRSADPKWSNLMEVHDSFYIGSDVFYTYIVMNGCWEDRQNQRDSKTFLEGIESAREKILAGTFPNSVIEKFRELLDYFGQTPIIVRSSSLLEDNFGNAFSGKYESVFCVNQGTPAQRLDDFLDAIREIYASTLSPEALIYRQSRGLLDVEEQMAILVQRVSGAVYGQVFIPVAAGVGLSYNPYAWSRKIDPKAGMVRLVCGLGTRAVDRCDDDYTMIIALNDPDLKPEHSLAYTGRYAQRNVDVLDLPEGRLSSTTFNRLCEIAENFPVDIVSTTLVPEVSHHEPQGYVGEDVRILSFDRMLHETSFVSTIRSMLATLQAAYAYPVDVEFTVNINTTGDLKINLVQCRPLQTNLESTEVTIPSTDSIPDDKLVFRSSGSIIGKSIITRIEQVVYIDPARYGTMSEQDRHYVARLVGRLTHLPENRGKNKMLIGPGRWGTSMASLGIPVTFAEINTVSVLCEIVEMNEGLVPNVSLGTHFFNDLVESNILYIAMFPGEQGSILNRSLLTSGTNAMKDMLPQEVRFHDVIHVINTPSETSTQRYVLHADSLKQETLCYIT